MNNLRFRIPGLADLLVVRDPQEMRRLDADGRVDRCYAASGSRLARAFGRRARRTACFDGVLFPALQPRASAARQAGTKALAERLGANPASFRAVGALGRIIAGEAGAPDAEVLVRQAITEALGQAEAAPDTDFVDDANLLNRALRLDPLRESLFRRRINRARERVEGACSRDAHLGHALVVGAPNIVAAIGRLRQTFMATPECEAGEAVRASLKPPLVLRTASAPLETGDGAKIGPATLIFYKPAARREAWDERVFAAGRWTACPAQHWIVQWLEAGWRSAAGGPAHESGG